MSFRTQAIVVFAIAVVPATALSWPPWKKGRDDRMPAASSAGNASLSALLERDGWVQTPFPASKYKVGTIIQIEGTAHVPWARDCIASEIDDSHISSVDIEQQMKVGGLFDAEVGQGNVEAHRVQEISFVNPIERTALRGSLQLSENCIGQLQNAGAQGTDLSKLYLVLDTLVADIHQCKSWGAGAGAEVSPFGGGGLGASSSCKMATDLPVAVAYRYQWVSESKLTPPRKCSSTSQEVRTQLDRMEENRMRFKELADLHVVDELTTMDVYQMLVGARAASWTHSWEIQALVCDLTGIDDRARCEELADRLTEMHLLEADSVNASGVGGEFTAVDAYRLMREEIPANVSGIRTAEIAYEVGFDVFLPIAPPVPVTEEGIDCDMREWPTGTLFDKLGFEPVVTGGVRGTYWVEVVDDGQDFVVHGMCDVDDDGVSAHYTATKTSPPKRQTEDSVY